MKVFSALALTTSLFSSSLYAGEFYTSVGGGGTRLDLTPAFSINRIAASPRLITVGSYIGYKSDINVLIETGISYGITSDSLFSDDNYRLSETRLLVGYFFDVSNLIKIIPKIGANRWSLRSRDRDGSIFSRRTVENRRARGGGVFKQVDIEFHITKRIQIYGSYVQANYDFGKLDALTTGVRFAF